MSNETYASSEDKEMFLDILDQNVRLLLGNLDKFFKDVFYEKIFSKMKYLNIYDWEVQDEFLNDRIFGYTEFSYTGETGIKMYGNKNYDGDKSYLKKIFSHEIWHALMTILNYTYGSTFKRDIKIGEFSYEVQNYSGFLMCSNENVKFNVGYFMAECLSQLLAIGTIDINENPDYKIDDVFNYKIEDESNSSVDDLLTFGQLFVAAFNLDSDFGYSYNYKKGEGLINYQVNTENKKYVLANIFITGSIKNPIMVMDEFDKYMGHGAYVILQKRLDQVYYKYRDEGIVDIKEFLSLCNELKSFVHMRLYYYLNNDIISKNEYDKLLNNFNELYKEFRGELKLYKVNTRRVKYKKKIDKLYKEFGRELKLYKANSRKLKCEKKVDSLHKKR